MTWRKQQNSIQSTVGRVALQGVWGVDGHAAARAAAGRAAEKRANGPTTATTCHDNESDRKAVAQWLLWLTTWLAGRSGCCQDAPDGSPEALRAAEAFVKSQLPAMRMLRAWTAGALDSVLRLVRCTDACSPTSEGAALQSRTM